jgi:hypothetical protein
VTGDKVEVVLDGGAMVPTDVVMVGVVGGAVLTALVTAGDGATQAEEEPAGGRGGALQLLGGDAGGDGGGATEGMEVGVTGQMVVLTAITTVVTTVLWAGQWDTSGPQLVMVWVVVV